MDIQKGSDLRSKHAHRNKKGKKVWGSGFIGSTKFLKRARIHSAGFHKKSMESRIKKTSLRKHQKKLKSPQSSKKELKKNPLFSKIQKRQMMKTVNLLEFNKRDLTLASGLNPQKSEKNQIKNPTGGEIGKTEEWDSLIQNELQNSLPVPIIVALVDLETDKKEKSEN